MNTIKETITKKKSSSKLTFSRSDIFSLAEEVLSGVNDRAQEILSVRYGLEDGNPKSLSAIGRKMGITRERVRQIEADSFKKLKDFSKSDKYHSLIKNATKIIEQKGGFCEKSTLKESLVKEPIPIERNQLIFLLNSSSELHFKKGTLVLKGFWYKEKAFKIDNIILIHDDLLNFFKKEKEVVEFDDIWKYIQNTSWGSFFEIPEGKERLRMILLLSKTIQSNLLGEWGLNNWRSIAERGSREKAHLVLKKYEEPLHFRKITDYINLHWSNKEALSQTVHNELIKDERFVLVGRGIYGLTEWGLSGGTVREIIISLMEDKGSPLHKDVIVTHVLNKKKVKEMTILVNLANQSYFNKDEEGRYFIKA